jgi:hypothetical protein
MGGEEIHPATPFQKQEKHTSESLSLTRMWQATTKILKALNSPYSHREIDGMNMLR